MYIYTGFPYVIFPYTNYLIIRNIRVAMNHVDPMLLCLQYKNTINILTMDCNTLIAIWHLHTICRLSTCYFMFSSMVLVVKFPRDKWTNGRGLQQPADITRCVHIFLILFGP